MSKILEKHFRMSLSVDELRQRINQKIEQLNYGDSPKELYDPIQYIMQLGGKRLRPILTLLGYSIFQADWEKVLKPAIAVEVFHNFTLMHDDIMDDAPLRRGKATVHEKWNSNVAILSGDVMLVRAYDLLLEMEVQYLKQGFTKFNKCASEVCEGQQMDMNFEERTLVTEEEYLEMIRRKTAVLLGFALSLGGLLAGANASQVDLMCQFGENIGIGFQLKDDLMDVYADADKFGKQVGGDIIANKKTFLLIKAIEKAEGTYQEELNHWINLIEFDKEKKVQAVTHIYNQLGIKELTEQKIDSYFQQAFQQLEALDINATQKEPLIQFTQWLINRES